MNVRISFRSVLKTLAIVAIVYASWRYPSWGVPAAIGILFVGQWLTDSVVDELIETLRSIMER